MQKRARQDEYPGENNRSFDFVTKATFSAESLAGTNGMRNADIRVAAESSGRGVAADGWDMVRHIAAIGMGSFLFLAVCVMVAQSPGQSLPDDPSVRIQSQSQSQSQSQRMNAFEHAKPLDVGAKSSYAPNLNEAEFAVYQNDLSRQKDPNTLFAKYLKPPSSNRKPGYSPAGAENLMDRAVHAASRTFITRDESGKGRINTSYFLRTFTAVVADTASTTLLEALGGRTLQQLRLQRGQQRRHECVARIRTKSATGTQESRPEVCVEDRTARRPLG